MFSDNKLKVAVVSHDIAWGDKEENLLGVAELLNKVEKDTDLVVLPELFSTGYIQDESMIAEYAEPLSGKTMDAIRRWSKYFGFAICGSYMASTAGAYYNRAFLVEPSGDETFYDKRHLFSLSQEGQVFSAGTQRPPIIRYRGWNISMIICYDLRFPVWCRNNGSLYDLLVVPANWPQSRGYAWEQLLIGRAIENQSYVIGANRSGRDDYGEYLVEQSIVVDYKGQKINLCRKKEISHAVLSRDALLEFREKFPVWKDADEFNLSD